MEHYGRRRSSQIHDPMHFDSERAPEARGRDLNDLPKSYWVSLLFVGSFMAIGMGFAAATGGFALIAPLLGVINEDIGPSTNIIWVALVYLLCQAVFFLIVSRLSDIFGRRWFFITGSVIGLIGSIFGATAQNVNQLIGAEVFIGIAAGFQISFFWVVGELVPMKYRYLASSGAYSSPSLPTPWPRRSPSLSRPRQLRAGEAATILALPSTLSPCCAGTFSTTRRPSRCCTGSSWPWISLSASTGLDYQSTRALCSSS